MVGVVLVNAFVVAIVVLVHFECLYYLTRLLPRLRIHYRYRILVGVFGALAAHTVEVWIFALAYYVQHHAAAWGQLEGRFNGSLLECVYFSFTVYTTLGFGDIVPGGSLRYLAGIEALTGLVMITWSASFVFVEMQKEWGS